MKKIKSNLKFLYFILTILDINDVSSYFRYFLVKINYICKFNDKFKDLVDLKILNYYAFSKYSVINRNLNHFLT